MECPVCYDCEARCVFVCGHSFCYQCVKKWYQKGTSTCPMCRNSMCFRGITDVKKVWEQEKREKILEDVIEELLYDIDEYEEHEYGVCIMNIIYTKYNNLINAFPYIDDKTLDFIIRNPWIEVDKIKKCVFYEVPTYMRYLMVPKTSYGVKIN